MSVPDPAAPPAGAPVEAVPAPGTPDRDLGFGSVVAAESTQRLLNRDGSFNVQREGLSLVERISPYHTLLTMRWAPFLALLTLGYITANALFAGLYVLLGPGALRGTSLDGHQPFLEAFFFSVHTFATIGYGNVTPYGPIANALVVVESLVGLLTVALATGLIFARFARPVARIRFSRWAIVAPFQGGTALMFRIVNARNNQLIELSARFTFSRFVPGPAGRPVRRFDELALERTSVMFFPLAWTIVHPITSASPLWGFDDAALREADAEFTILLSGTDETFAQVVHARSSYKADEIRWGVRFADLFIRRGHGVQRIDVAKLDDVVPAG